MKVTRTFIAVDISAPVRTRAGSLIDRLAVTSARVNWVAPENMHLTIKFLGDQTDEQLAAVCQAVGTAATSVPPFDFECHGAGAFPSVSRPRTIWIGVRSGNEGFARLHQAIERELEQIGIAKDHRAFHPHLTIGRVRSGGAAQIELGKLIERQHDYEVGVSDVDEVIVFASKLERTGPTYQVVARAALEG